MVVERERQYGYRAVVVDTGTSVPQRYVIHRYRPTLDQLNYNLPPLAFLLGILMG